MQRKLLKNVATSFAAVSLFFANPSIAQVAEEGGTPNVQGSTNQQIGFSSSINQNAGESKAKHGMAVASSALSTAMMIGMAETAKKAKNPFMATVYYGFAAYSALQGLDALKGQKQSGNVQDLSGLGGFGGGTGGTGTDVNYDVDLPLPPGARDASGRALGIRKVNPKEVLELAAKNGVKVNPKTGELTMPDGKKVSANSLSSPAGLEALGVSSDDANEVFAALDSAAQQASSGFKAVRMDVDSSGGGGGGGKSNARSVSSYPGFKFPGFGEQPKAASVAGLTKMANGEPIGVAGDDIFKMMQRAYGSRQGHGMFIEE